MRNILIIVLIAVFASCNPAKKTEDEKKVAVTEKTTYKLELVWASDTLLRTPESVFFDKNRSVLYISNINLNPWEKDGNGFISKMDLSGNIIDLKWVEGLNAPKGMGVAGNTLYVADIDEIVQIDLESGRIMDRISVSGNPDLNDITVGDDGTVYVSGSSSNKIYAFKDGKISEFLTGGDDERFNGLYWEKNRLLLITSGTGQFKAIDWATKKVSIISENMGHGDAIAAVGDGSYLTSDWDGAVYHVSPEGSTTKLLDTKANNENAADFCYSVDNHLLFIPTFNANRVKAYKLIY